MLLLQRSLVYIRCVQKIKQSGHIVFNRGVTDSHRDVIMLYKCPTRLLVSKLVASRAISIKILQLPVFGAPIKVHMLMRDAKEVDDAQISST